MTDYRQPLGLDVLDHVPTRGIDWVAQEDEHGNPVKGSWWSATITQWGGRQTDVVVASAGEMYVFNRHGHMIGAAEATVHPEPGAEVFWPLAEADSEAPPYQLAYTLRGTGLMVADVDGIVGLTLQEGVASGTHGAWAWRVALGHVLLGYYPYVPAPITPEEWEIGVGEIGEAAARRVKRALLIRTADQGRALRQRSAALSAHWN